jgi:hypothetical protein
MTITTNVPAPTFGPTGFVPPTEQAILTGVQEDYNSAFGGDLDPSLETPQGQLASSTTAIIAEANSQFANITQQVDPAFATGRMQDAIARIYFLERLPSEPTVTQCQCSGLSGVVIPVGALAVDEDGNIYTCTEAGVIPSGGSITLTFACNTLGPVPCPANTLNAIYQAIPGWDSVNNSSDGVIGQNTETPAQFEARRAQSVAQNSIGSLSAILGAVLSVPGVLDAYVTENVNNTTTTIGGVSLAAHSLYVAVVGGLAQSVANAIWSKKAPGCGYNGNTTETVTDSNSGYSLPFPTYQVTFEIPSSVPILFAVTIANNALVPSNAATLIQNAIISAFAGGDGGPRARIGSTVYASRFYAAIAALGSWAQIVSLQVGSINDPVATFTGAIVGTALTVSGVTGTIAIGQTVLDAAGEVLPGTTIVSGSGTSWVVSNSQTVTSESMATALPNQNLANNNINQEPTISANNIAVTIS